MKIIWLGLPSAIWKVALCQLLAPSDVRNTVIVAGIAAGWATTWGVTATQAWVTSRKYIVRSVHPEKPGGVTLRQWAPPSSVIRVASCAWLRSLLGGPTAQPRSGVNILSGVPVYAEPSSIGPAGSRRPGVYDRVGPSVGAAVAVAV